jgi:hypothetical protein
MSRVCSAALITEPEKKLETALRRYVREEQRNLPRDAGPASQSTADPLCQQKTRQADSEWRAKLKVVGRISGRLHPRELMRGLRDQVAL